MTAQMIAHSYNKSSSHEQADNMETQIVKRSDRDDLLGLLAEVTSGQLSFSDFSSRDFGRSEDYAVSQIYLEISELISDDLNPHASLVLDPEKLAIIHRSIEFLRTDLPYLWPPSPSPSLPRWNVLLVFLMSMGNIAVLLYLGLPFAVLCTLPIHIIGVIIAFWIAEIKIQRIIDTWSKLGSPSDWPFLRSKTV
jgi:hypothetical protein